MATLPISVREAVAQAVQNQTTTEVEPGTQQQEQTEQIEEFSEQVLEVNATPEEITQALDMFRNLSDPVKAREFIKSLNLQETKVSPQQATETILDILTNALGEENSDLAQKLAPALEKLIAKEVKAPVQQLTVDQEIREAKAEIDNLFNKLNNDPTMPDFKKLSDDMGVVMQQVQPAKGVSMESYMRNIYKLAGGAIVPEKTSSSTSSTKTTAKTAVRTVVNKMVKNAQETKQNVSSNVEEGRTSQAPTKMSVRQAVLSAVQELQK